MSALRVTATAKDGTLKTWAATAPDPSAPAAGLLTWRGGANPVNTLAKAQAYMRQIGVGCLSDPTGSAYEDVNVSGNGITLDLSAQTVTKKRLWGKVIPHGAHLVDCVLPGPDPDLVAQLYGSLQNFGSVALPYTMENCTIDPSLWKTMRNKTQNAFVVGVHGGNGLTRRTEIVWAQDGANILGPTDPLLAAAQRTLYEECWIHAGYYPGTPWPHAAGNYPHGDPIQTNFVKHLLVRLCLLGGWRDPAGYAWWSSKSANTGDDFFNTGGAMLKQEVESQAKSTPGVYKIEDVVIDDNIIGGGVSGINHSIADGGTDWDGCKVTNNRFVKRGPDWGNFNRDGTAGPNKAINGGYYIVSDTASKMQYANNTILETGEPVPFTKG